MNNDDRRETIDNITSKYLAAMSEYCDCVQIHLSFYDSDGMTIGTHDGIGNIYARNGLAAEFLQNESARNHFHIKESEYQ